MKKGGKKLSRTLVTMTFIPYLFVLATVTRSLAPKLAGIYAYYLFFNPLYDYGLLLKTMW